MGDWMKHYQDRYAELYRSARKGEALDTTLAAQNVSLAVGLMRQVISDEVPKHIAALLEPPKPPTPPQPEAEAGDVPEWFHKAACGGSMSSHKVRALWEQVEREYENRVAEAVAAKDKRIAELDRILGDCNAAFQRVDAKLAAAQAEVERLTNTHCHIMSKGDKCVCTLCKQDAEIANLRAEVSRLSRPVDKESIYARWADIGKFISTVNEFASAVAPLLQSERNARESAEAERDELREACNKYVAISNTSDENKKYTMYAASERHGTWGNRCVDYAYDTPADAVLAAYRAERAVKHGDS